MSILTVDIAGELLRERREELAKAVQQKKRERARAARTLPPIFLIDDDYTITMRQAEIDWLDRTLEAITSCDLNWDPDTLVARSHLYER